MDTKSDNRTLAPEEEQQLWQACRAGDADAREKLIIAYRPMVFWLAGKLKVATFLRQDLIQEGMLALINSVDRFDVTRDLRFTTFAYHRIHGQMINLLERSERRAPIPVDDEFLSAAVPEPEPGDENWYEVAASINKLSGKEATVVSALFFDGKGPSEIAAEQKIDVSHVYRIRRSAIAKIRSWLGLGNALANATDPHQTGIK